MNRRLLAVPMLLLVVAASLASVADANFNAATGFSGRQGFTCTSCHNVPDMGPLGDDEIYDEPAKVLVTGLPEAWDHGESYRVDIVVEGGPPEISTGPIPSGGFEIETDRGTFTIPKDMEHNARVYAEDGTGVTYTQAGAMIRFWAVTWNAPELDESPEEATFWVAGMAANGNHVVATNTSDQGELGDSVDNVTITVPPSQETLDAWALLVLDTPAVESFGLLFADQPFTIRGQHTDPEATHLGYKLDDDEWKRSSAPATKWSLEFTAGLGQGEHVLLIRSESEERISEAVRLDLDVQDAADAPQPTSPETPRATPFPSVLVGGGLLAAVGWRRMR